MGVLQQLQVHRWPFNTAQKHFHLNWHVLIGPQNVLIGITFIELHLEGLFLKTFGFCFSFFFVFTNKHHREAKLCIERKCNTRYVNFIGAFVLSRILQQAIAARCSGFRNCKRTPKNVSGVRTCKRNPQM